MTPIVFIDVRVFDGQRNIRIVLRPSNIRHPKGRPLVVVVDRDGVLNPHVRPSAERRFEAANDNHPTSPDGVA